MATWKKILTKDSAVGSDGLLFLVTAANAEGATLRLSDGSTSDDIVLVAGAGIDFSSSSEGGFTIQVDTSEITSAIQGELTDATLISSTSGDDVVLTLTGPGGETDAITLEAGGNITLTEAGDGSGLTIASTDTNTQLSQEQVQDFAWAAVGGAGTETGISVTYQDATHDVDFIVDDQTLESSTSNTTNVTLSMSNPSGTDDTVEIVAGDNITLTNNSAGQFTIAASATASNVSVTDSDVDETAYLVFTTSTSGSAALKVDSSTLSYNASSDTLTVNNLTVAGTQTTVNTTDLVVADKNIVIADGSADAATASGAGITVDIAATLDNMPQFLWTNGGSLTGWSLSNYDASGNVDVPVAVMEFDAATGAPGASDNAGGVGSFQMNTADGKLYIRTA
jgi:hypothetical protein